MSNLFSPPQLLHRLLTMSGSRLPRLLGYLATFSSSAVSNAAVVINDLRAVFRHDIGQLTKYSAECWSFGRLRMPAKFNQLHKLGNLVHEVSSLLTLHG